jgi:phosphoglucomutase
MTPHAYSRHTYEELEAARDPHQAERLAAFARGRIEGKRGELITRVDNIKTLCLDVAELLDHMDGNNAAHLGVDTRGLNARLRLVEQELLAATDALADQLGLVAM